MNKPKPKKYKRQPIERTRDRTRIASMYLNGSNQTEIANELKISQPTVSREIKLLEGEWIERSSKDIDTWKAGEVAYLLAKRRELEEIWKASQNRISIIKTKRATMVNGIVTQQEISEREELELADSKIGQLLLSVADHLSALIGMDAPKRDEVRNLSIIDDFILNNIDLFTDGQVQRLKSGEDKSLIMAEVIRDAIKK